MLPGDYDQHADVRELVTYGVVEGVSYPIESVTLDREIANYLPDNVAAGTGVAGGSGTIVWASRPDVEAVEVSPWHEGSWPPSPGAQVRVYVSDGTTSWPRFTGLIDQTRGSVGGQISSRIIDYRDRLNVPFTREALLQVHVPLETDGPIRRIGLRFWALLTLALRRAGFYNTPEAGDNPALSVPLQGTGWAHSGATTECHGATESNTPGFYNAPWGLAVGEIRARYWPTNAGAPTMSQAVQIGFLVAPDHSGTTHIRTIYGSATHRIRIRVEPDRGVTAFLHNTVVVRLTGAQMQGANHVMLLVRQGNWTLRNNAGAVATGAASPPGSSRMAEVQLDGDSDARIAGLVIRSPAVGVEFSTLNFTPNVTFSPSGLVGQTEMTPRLEKRNLSDFVDEVCKATLTAAWFDESGVLRLVPSDLLQSPNAVQTVTTLDDIVDLEWQTSLLHMRSAVHVNWKSPSISRSRQQRIELFRGSGESMGSHDVVEVFATPDANTEWFAPGRDPTLVDFYNWGAVNRGRGSFVGVHYTDSDGEIPTNQMPNVKITVEPLGLVSLKITHESPALPSDVDANLSIPRDDTRLRESRKGERLPVIRGFGLGVWSDETISSDITGQESAPELEHDLSYWGNANSASRIARFLAERVTRVEPSIERLSVVYDPRRQLGDIVNIELGVLDVSLRALIVGVHESHTPGSHTQDLTVRILAATSARGVTYQELEEAWRGGDYSALEAVWRNLNNEALEDDSTRFAPNQAQPVWFPPSAAKYAVIDQVWKNQTYEQLQADVTGEDYDTFSNDLSER